MEEGSYFEIRGDWFALRAESKLKRIKNGLWLNHGFIKANVDKHRHPPDVLAQPLTPRVPEGLLPANIRNGSVVLGMVTIAIARFFLFLFFSKERLPIFRPRKKTTSLQHNYRFLLDAHKMSCESAPRRLPGLDFS